MDTSRPPAASEDPAYIKLRGDHTIRFRTCPRVRLREQVEGIVPRDSQVTRFWGSGKNGLACGDAVRMRATISSLSRVPSNCTARELNHHRLPRPQTACEGSGISKRRTSDFPVAWEQQRDRRLRPFREECLPWR